MCTLKRVKTVHFMLYVFRHRILVAGREWTGGGEKGAETSGKLLGDPVSNASALPTVRSHPRPTDSKFSLVHP